MKPEDFDSFFTELHGYEPFPWQARLAREVAVKEAWPRVLGLPTSAGKTAVIDIAIFALALQAGRLKRTAPLRTFFVIDRRIVVDEAFERAKHIAGRLRDPNASTILREVATRLKTFTQGLSDEPLHVAALRGGMYREGTWAKSPVQPTVCVSTVDQVGSRLLFRGYGVSEHQRAIHAGLVGNDSLVIVDEAHLSQPFLATLEAVERYRCAPWAEVELLTPFKVVRMSATAPPSEEPFKLDPVEDYENEELGRRLRASKLARREEIATDPNDEEANRKKFAEAAAYYARLLAGLEEEGTSPAKGKGKNQPAQQAAPVRVVGVVVNRVATARRIFDLLAEDTTRCHAILLTGRIRPFDRDELLYRKLVAGERGWFPFMAAVKKRPQLPVRLFVVATQTVEVGANISFDALVTEAAPLDALRQRFGRLDRLGLRETSHAVIIARKDALGTASDPIYEKAVAETWKWLKTQQVRKGKEAVVDFGLSALKPPEDPDELEPLCSPRSSAPLMLPAHMDTWAQTSPRPKPDPDVSLFLHGPKSGPPDVQIVWRGDLPEQLNRLEEETYITTVATVPPTSMESLSVPISAARAWLAGSPAKADCADVEGEPSPNLEESRPEHQLSLRWRGPDDSKLVNPEEIRPGDTLVVPASRGGADEFGWKPGDQTPVRDVGDACSLWGRCVPVLRLHERVLVPWGPAVLEGQDSMWARIHDALTADEDGERYDPKGLLKILAAVSDLPEWLRQTTDLLQRQARPIKSVGYPGHEAVALIGRRVSTLAVPVQIGEGFDRDDFTNEDDTASLTSPLPLTKHCEDVRNLAGQFARFVGLPPELCADLGLAGWLHDVGKADPRFQVWLHEGDEVEAAAAKELLAKSGMDPRNRAAMRWARERAGYPAGGRHECLSVALLRSNTEAMKNAHHPDLVLYLIGTHHGRGRPFMPVVSDSAPVEVELTHGGVKLRSSSRHGLERLDSGWTDRFWAVLRRYGWWGLTLLETILQLADHRCSEQAQNAEER